MKTKVIVVEIRQVNKASEKGLYGQATFEDGVSKVFINAKQSQGEMIDTFFHEMAHVFIEWNGQVLSAVQEERLARLVGNMAEVCFRRKKK